jgi:hypothetical protein
MTALRIADFGGGMFKRREFLSLVAGGAAVQQ